LLHWGDNKFYWFTKMSQHNTPGYMTDLYLLYKWDLEQTIWVCDLKDAEEINMPSLPRNSLPCMKMLSIEKRKLII
jgi:hypothetical protein